MGPWVPHPICLVAMFVWLSITSLHHHSLLQGIVPMTQLWRRANEEVRIGDDVTVRVLEVGLTFVRLGITTRGANPGYREVELTRQPTAADPETTADPLAEGRPRFS